MNRISETDKYNQYILEAIVKLAPVVGLLAAVTFSVSYFFLGYFQSTPMKSVLIFDAVSAVYIVIAVIFMFIGKYSKKIEKSKLIKVGKVVLSVLVVVQWNLISYLFPSRAFWGYAPLFLVLIVFFFDSKLTLRTALALILSIAASWVLKGDELLPVRDAAFGENLILRIVAILVSLYCIYAVTKYGERFIRSADEHLETAEMRAEKLQLLSDEIINFTADLVEQRDESSGEHIKRVAGYVEIIAQTVSDTVPRYSFTDAEIEMITRASVMHDVGKIYVPDNILKKPGKLTDEEYEIIKNHTRMGEKIAYRLPEETGFVFKRYAAEICLYHHERVDGSGYPEGLAGNQIPIAAQIVALADTFDALTSDRPYKKALPVDEAIEMISRGECGAFSEDMISCLRLCSGQLEECLNSSLKA